MQIIFQRKKVLYFVFIELFSHIVHLLLRPGSNLFSVVACFLFPSIISHLLSLVYSLVFRCIFRSTFMVWYENFHFGDGVHLSRLSSEIFFVRSIPVKVIRLRIRSDAREYNFLSGFLSNLS